MDNDFNWDDHNRRIVLEGRQVLERTTASLARSNQIAIETEQVGTEVNTHINNNLRYKQQKYKLSHHHHKFIFLPGYHKSGRTKRIIVAQSTSSTKCQRWIVQIKYHTSRNAAQRFIQ